MEEEKYNNEWYINWKCGRIELLEGDYFYKTFLKKYPLSAVKKMQSHIWRRYV